MNNVSLVGRLTKEPKIDTVKDNTQRATFTVAVQRKHKNKDGQYDSDFINCVAFGKTAEIIGRFFHKASWIGVNGNIQTRSYDAQDGTKRFVTEVYTDSIEFVGAKVTTDAAPAQNTGNDGFVEVNDDDLPF